MKNCCGKDCESCTVREAEQCPGCRHIADFGECEIVSCCKDKGHESCSTCTQQTWCPTVQKSISMPKYRREKADAEAENAVSQFLNSVGVIYLAWPQSQTKPDGETNRALLNEEDITILKIEQVECDVKNKLIEGSEKLIQI